MGGRRTQDPDDNGTFNLIPSEHSFPRDAIFPADTQMKAPGDSFNSLFFPLFHLFLPPSLSFEAGAGTMAKPGLFRTLSASIKLPVVNSSGAPRPSIDNHADFISHETKREDDFLQCMKVQQSEYAEEQDRFWYGDEDRFKRFEDFLFNSMSNTREKEVERQQEFEAMQKAQSGVYAKHESARTKRYNESRVQRGRASDECQKEWAKDAEWHQGVRDATLRSTRNVQVETARELRHALDAQMTEILADEEKKFSEHEKRRENMTNAALSSRTFSMGTDNTVTQSVFAPKAGVFECEDLCRGRTISDSSRRCRQRSQTPSPRSRSYSPPNTRPFGLLSSPQPPIIVHIPSSRSSRSSSSGPWIRHKEYTRSEEPTPDTLVNSPTNQFVAAQEDRMKRFLQDEESRDKQFFQGEDIRNAAEELRMTRFREVCSTLKDAFREQSRGFQDIFSATEDVRNQAENSRDEEYNAEAAMMDGKLEVILAKLKDQQASKLKVEELEDGSLKVAVNRHLAKQNKIREKARLQRDKRFNEAQAHREALIRQGATDGHPHSSVPTIASMSSASLAESRRSRSHRRHSRGRSGRYYSPPHDRLRTRSRSPRYSTGEPCILVPPTSAPSRRAPSPTAGFDPRALFISRDLPSLPTPDDHVLGNNNPVLKGCGQDPERRRQNLYTKSKELRLTIFTAGMARRKSIFAAGEAKRRTAYERAQQKREAKFLDYERRWEHEFRKSQTQMGRTFLIAEKSRAAKFAQKEIARAKLFKDQQLRRQGEYHLAQTQLTNGCFAEAEKRVDVLQQWADSIREKQLKDAERAYKREEAARELRFHKWLAAHDRSGEYGTAASTR